MCRRFHLTPTVCKCLSISRLSLSCRHWANTDWPTSTAEDCGKWRRRRRRRSVVQEAQTGEHSSQRASNQVNPKRAQLYRTQSLRLHYLLFSLFLVLFLFVLLHWRLPIKPYCLQIITEKAIASTNTTTGPPAFTDGSSVEPSSD